MDKVDFKGRILIQNCISAKLQLNWDQINSVSEQSAEFVTVENALVIYVCFKDSLYTCIIPIYNMQCINGFVVHLKRPL